ncbi:MAG: hypothetical protein ATN36_00195 [Epulopiscium sp. Nele67-Bin005]|nr:MAG: hypothetical protein ATN36_00195 [Epulopiscium sp. Nele67-Bin005]
MSSIIKGRRIREISTIQLEYGNTPQDGFAPITAPAAQNVGKVVGGASPLGEEEAEFVKFSVDDEEEDFATNFPDLVAEEEVQEEKGSIAQEQASEMLADAKKQADEIVMKAKDEAKEFLDEIDKERQAFDKEIQATRKKAETEAKKMVDDATKKVKQLKAEAETEKKAILVEAEQEVINLINHLTSHLIGHELRSSSKWLHYIVRNMLNHQSLEQKFCVNVSPTVYNNLTEDEIKQIEGMCKDLTITENANLKEFACTIGTETGDIYYDVNEGLETLCKDLLLLQQIEAK